MSAPLPAAAIAATAESAGLSLPPGSAQRIATALSPAFATFAPIIDTLPFDLEPATFLAVQRPAPAEEER